MILFFRLPNGLTKEHPEIDPREKVKYLKEYTEDLLCTRYDMTKIKYYITCNDYILVDNSKSLCDLKCNLKSYDTIHIFVTKLI